MLQLADELDNTPHKPQIIGNPLQDCCDGMLTHTLERVELAGTKAHYVDDLDVQELMSAWRESEKHYVQLQSEEKKEEEGSNSLSQLRVLDLSLNRLTDVGAKSIAEAVTAIQGLHQRKQPSSSIQLQSLELDSNKIGDEGMNALSKALFSSTPCCPLTRLDLSGNKITDESILQLMQYLSSAGGALLNTLLLRDNVHFTNVTMDAISKWLQSASCPLVSLHVSGNNFTDACLPALIEALKKNTKLTDLNFSNVQIFDFKPLIQDLEESNETIKTVHLAADGKKLDLPQLKQVLQRNRDLEKKRRSEILRLKEEHQKELQKLKAQHEETVSLLKKEVASLRQKLAAVAPQ